MIIDRTINFPEVGEVSSTQSYVLVGLMVVEKVI